MRRARVENEAVIFHLTGTTLQLVDKPSHAAHTFSLTPQALTQAIFGYTALVNVLRQQGLRLPGDLATVLTILFPGGQTWIAASDWF